jgi:hypothetical protein
MKEWVGGVHPEANSFGTWFWGIRLICKISEVTISLYILDDDTWVATGDLFARKVQAHCVVGCGKHKRPKAGPAHFLNFLSRKSF